MHADFEVMGQSALDARASGPLVFISAWEELDSVEPEHVVVLGVRGPQVGLLVGRCVGIVSAESGVASHVAIVAREAGIACFVGIDGAAKWRGEYTFAELNGSRGLVELWRDRP